MTRSFWNLGKEKTARTIRSTLFAAFLGRIPRRLLVSARSLLGSATGTLAHRRAALHWGLATVVALTLAAEAGSASAQGVAGSTFEQPGKLKFKYKDKFASPGAFGSQSSFPQPVGPHSSKVKFESVTLVEFGPGDDLAAGAFRIAMLFSEGGLVRLEGTYTENRKGKIKLEPDDTPIIEDLDDLVLGGLKKCKVKAKFKIVDEEEPRVAKTKVKTKCKLTNVKPPQTFTFKAKGKGPETTRN